ncbi:hypothetical protein BJV74DRAFT_110510 [Russula compacta]|nr:hypothetical protein BJV74DRAFT_110510 [Russula compacta]
MPTYPSHPSRRRSAAAADAADSSRLGLARRYSDNSTAAIPRSCFWTHDFSLAASMVVIQPSSGKVVVVNDTAKRSWFLPRGRKDVGETLEQCALREAYEESGYRIEFLPLYLPSRAPAPPSRPNARGELMVSEPVFITTSDFGPYARANGQIVDHGGQYITFYYVGQIPADAVREQSTGMPDEVHYVGKLLELEEALRRLPRFQAHITETVYRHWLYTVETEERGRNAETDRRELSRRFPRT